MGSKKTERLTADVDAEFRERVDACRRWLAERGPEPSEADTVRYLLKRGLEAVEAEARSVKKRVVR